MHETYDDHIDPTAELTIETVKERSVKGVIILTGRYFVLYGISLIAQIFLGALLTIQQFGIFGIVSAVVNFLVYFADIGLAAALIQKKEKVTRTELTTTFTIQQSLVGLLLLLLFTQSSRIQSFYGLSQDAVYLLWALGISFLLSSLKTIPAVLLERRLLFDKLAIASVVETLVYNIVLVWMAWQGYGISSFTFAVLARGITGFVTLYAFQPWMPGISFDKKAFKHLMSFGLPYQVNTFLAVFKDDGLAIVLGKILGFEALGILVWAQKWAQVPLRLFMDTVTKVTFPAFARMQDEKVHLERAVTRSIFFISFLVFPTIIGLLSVSPLLIELVPRYEKWRVALIPLAIVSINVGFAAVTTQLTNLFNAIGKIKLTFKLMIMWTVLTWLVIPVLAIRYSYIGASIGYAIVGASSVVAIAIAKRYVNFSLIESAGKPLLGSLVMGALLLMLRSILPIHLLSVALMVITGTGVYFGIMLFLIGKGLVVDAKRSVKVFRNK